MSRQGLLGRAVGLLLPAGRRDWAEAAWAEAQEVPRGWPRLAWRAGGVRLIAREAHLVRGTIALLAFAAASGAVAAFAWPGPADGGADAAQAGIVAVVALLAGLPLVSRWLLGPAGSRAGRWLRAGWYAAILATMAGIAVADMFHSTVPRGGHDLRTFLAFESCGPHVSCAADWAPGSVHLDSEVPWVVIMALGLAAILALTARRTPVTRTTLAIAAGAGLVLGTAMYAVDPLGINKYVTAPWLHGTMTDTIPGGWATLLVALAWIALIGAPLAASVLAALRSRAAGTSWQQTRARLWQGTAAGVITGGTGALLATVLGTGTTALLVRSAWARDLLYHGQHLTASALYGRELYASQNGYGAICLAFPVIGLILSTIGTGIGDRLATAGRPGANPPGPGGTPEPEPLPDAPGGRLASADAGQDGPALRPAALAGQKDSRPGWVGRQAG